MYQDYQQVNVLLGDYTPLGELSQTDMWALNLLPKIDNVNYD